MSYIPSPGRRTYQPSLYVPRPGGAHSGDAALSTIVAWVHDRIARRQAPSICRLEAPPGFGKSWALQRFVDQNKDALQDQLLIFGPFSPPAILDEKWRMAQIEKYLVEKPYELPLAHFRSGSAVPFQNLIRALMEDIERLAPRRHLLFVLDDVDQGSNQEELEKELLDPVARFSLDHEVSLLLALRSDFPFRTVEPLRRPSHFIRVVISSFTREQAEMQLLALAALPHSPPLSAAIAGSFVSSLIGSLPEYTWGVPALNAELLEQGMKIWNASALHWTCSDVLTCLLKAWRLDLAKKNYDFADKACALRWSHDTPAWRVRDLGARLGLIDEYEAAEFRDRLSALNVIERPPDATYGAYQLSPDWNSIFEACARL